MDVLKYMGAWFGVTAFFWVLFERADKVAKPEVRKSISKFLRNLEFGRSLNEWPKNFCLVFDSIFGERHFSWKCIFRSALASIISVWFLFGIFSLFCTKIAEMMANMIYIARLTLFFVLILIINVFFDYLSLLETRLILRQFGDQPTLLRIIAFLILDVVATVAIITIPFFSWPLIFGGFNSAIRAIKDFYSVWIWFKGTEPILAVFFYSTFFTSVWVWIYALVSIFVLILRKTERVWAFLKNIFLDIENKPILAMGWIASMIVTIIFIISIPFKIFF